LAPTLQRPFPIDKPVSMSRFDERRFDERRAPGDGERPA
jgi:hypothetical protein